MNPLAGPDSELAERALAAACERIRSAPLGGLRDLLRLEGRAVGVGPWGRGPADGAFPALRRLADAAAERSVAIGGSLSVGNALRLAEEGYAEGVAAVEAVSDSAEEIAGGTWEAPIPFGAAGDLPSFPTVALPATVGSWVQAESESTQTPEDLAGMIALSVLSTAVAKKYFATIRPEWREPLNIYAAVALPPGERKSAVSRDATAPLLDWERAALEREAPGLREAAAALEIAEGRLKEAKGRAIKAKSADRLVAEEEVRRLGEEAASLPRPVATRLLADDVTPERLFGILAEQGGRLGILSPEGGIFDLLAGRYSDGLPNLDAFLKAHAGDQLRVDRVGRPAEHLREPALTVGLAVQPAVIEGLADRPGFRGRGLLARFLYSLPRSAVGRRRVDPPAVPAEVTAGYAATVRTLLDLPVERGSDGEIVSRPLPFSAEALQALLRFSAELEPRLGDGGDLEAVRDWAAKLPGAVARIAAVLHLAHSDQCDQSDHPSTVPGAAVERAIMIGRYLIPHALAAFGLMGTNSENEDARFLLRWILRGQWKRFTKRKAWLGTRGRFKRAEDVDPPLGELEARGYIRREVPEDRSGPGRKPSPTYSVNPLAGDHNDHIDRNGAGGGGGRVPTSPPGALCPHCAAPPGAPHYRGRESACPRAEPLPATGAGGGA